MSRIVTVVVVLGLTRIAFAQGPLFVLQPIDRTGRVTYFIADGVDGSTFRQADRDLAVWALKQWEHALNGALHFESSAEHEAMVRVFWVPSKPGRYGETRAFDAGACTARRCSSVPISMRSMPRSARPRVTIR